MSKRKRTSDHEDTNRWLLTYADLLTLLLGFFVIMYSMSRIDAKRFGKMAEGLQGVFHGKESTEEKTSGVLDLGAGVLKLGGLKRLQQQVAGLAKYTGDDRVSASGGDITAAQVPPEITTEIDERGLVIHVLESALFESGKAELKPRAEKMLDQLYNQIKNLPNHVRVEGHTDNRPISTFRYPSNWELSTARAAAVVRYLTEKHHFPTQRISALGYGEYRPLAPNDSPANMAKNRRVDIVILTPAMSELEPETGEEQQTSMPDQNKVQKRSEILSLSPYDAP
jgi:chemotaxis protein MotB